VATWPEDARRGAVSAFCTKHNVSRAWFYQVRATAERVGSVKALEKKPPVPSTTPAATAGAWWISCWSQGPDSRKPATTTGVVQHRARSRVAPRVTPYVSNGKPSGIAADLAGARRKRTHYPRKSDTDTRTVHGVLRHDTARVLRDVRERRLVARFTPESGGLAHRRGLTAGLAQTS
jgi:hypothetical protein